MTNVVQFKPRQPADEGLPVEELFNELSQGDSENPYENVAFNLLTDMWVEEGYTDGADLEDAVRKMIKRRHLITRLLAEIDG